MKRILTLLLGTFVSIAAETVDIKNVSVSGVVPEGRARIVIEGFQTGAPEREKLLYSTTLNHVVQITPEKQTHTINATFEILQGEPRELALTMGGDGEIKSVIGEMLQDWSVRQETNGTRALVLRTHKGEKALTSFAVTIVAERATQFTPRAQPLL